MERCPILPARLGARPAGRFRIAIADDAYRAADDGRVGSPAAAGRTPPALGLADDAAARDESAWARRAAAGDREAFGWLYARFSPMVHGVLLAAVGPDRADDLMQEVFLRALRHLPEIRTPEALGGWLRSIARNAARDAWRASRSDAPLPDEVVTRDPPSGEAREALDAVRALPDAYRETLVLRLVEGMSGPEISKRTGLTPGSVRVNLHRGMKMLARRLEERRRP